jgi:hypothetical protein
VIVLGLDPNPQRRKAALTGGIRVWCTGAQERQCSIPDETSGATRGGRRGTRVIRPLLPKVARLSGADGSLRHPLGERTYMRGRSTKQVPLVALSSGARWKG